MQTSMVALLLWLTSLSAFAQTRTYSTAYTGADVIQAGTAPFNTLTPANTVVTNQAPYHKRIARLTDTSSLENGQSFTVPGGGSSDAVVTNWNGSLVALESLGGRTYVFGFNRPKMQIFPAADPTVSCSGATAFSRLKPGRWYCLAGSGFQVPGIGNANGTTIYAVDFASAIPGTCGQNAGCYDPSTAAWSVIKDIATCPEATVGAPTWTTFLGVGGKDVDLSVGMSWAGAQGTAHLFFDYRLSSPQTCITYDTVGNGTNAEWYDATGKPNVVMNYVTGEPLQASWKIHDGWTNGGWAEVQRVSCTGSDCGPFGANGPPLINLTTHAGYILAAYPKNGGHFSLSATLITNINNPQIEQRALADPETFKQTAMLGCSPCEDMHLSGDVNNDANPILGSRGIRATTTWQAPYMNEIIGVSSTGAIYRFSPTWSSGPATNFYGANAISGFSQDRRTAFMTSDMGCQLRADCGTDVFAVDLTGN